MALACRVTRDAVMMAVIAHTGFDHPPPSNTHTAHLSEKMRGEASGSSLYPESGQCPSSSELDLHGKTGLRVSLGGVAISVFW